MDSEKPKTWDEVFEAEVTRIASRRAVEKNVAKKNLVGLAFSGGGIRSATFGLGVLEGLKHCDLLQKIDYLSTVSGGGYIGAWLTGNCKRAADRSHNSDAFKALTNALDEAQNNEIAAVAAVKEAAAATDPARKANAEKDAALAAAVTTKAAAAKAAYEEACRDWLDKDTNWKDSIAHLRRYSNYLSPQVGFFSADTWSMATLWTRNTLLVQLTVILAIAVVLLLPRPLFAIFQKWPHMGNWRWLTVALFVMAVSGIAGNQLRLNKSVDVKLVMGKGWGVGLFGAAICLGAAWGWGAYHDFQPFRDGTIDWLAAAPVAFLLVFTGFFLLPVAVRIVSTFWPGDDPPTHINYTQGWVQGVVVMPMLAAGSLVAAILWGQTVGIYAAGELAQLDSFADFFTKAWRYWPLPLTVTFVSFWLLSFFSIRSWKYPKGLLVAFFAPVPAVAALHVLLCVIMVLLHGWASQTDEGAWLAFVWAPGMVLFAFFLSFVILIGMMGRQSTEGIREWWGRLAAWLGIYGVAWMLVAVAAVYGPQWAATILDSETWKGSSIIGGWLATTMAGLLAGKSEATGNGPQKDKAAKTTTEKLLNLVAIIAPFVFIAGLLIGIATCLHLIILSISNQDWSDMRALHLYHWGYMKDSPVTAILEVMGAAIALLLLLAWRVDINEFSLNAFYRNRLSRCYLGATRYLAGERNPQNFTGFDEKDDLPLADLSDAPGPLPIVNCALNLGGSSDLALHTRHSASFTLTPFAAGSNYLSRDQSGQEKPLGFQPIAEYGGKDGQPTLGQVISVSGAAASPNMGYHTSPVVAFLLTVFNVRLGWWFPNPKESGIKSPSPWFGLRYLFKELFGGADDKSNYLMISDGGHFENLAAYELVRRQCRLIIISDAECDPELKFEGLGTLIRMCEVDFGARITLDVSSIKNETSLSEARSHHCAIGTIDYGHGRKGDLLYIKAAMSGDEDSAVRQYKAVHPSFPHETTADQFFGEDQFESYRRLSRHIVNRVFRDIPLKTKLPEMILLLREQWTPEAVSASCFINHAKMLDAIWERLRTSPTLVPLRDELLAERPSPRPTAVLSAEEICLCSEIIQLMENIFLDLHLEDNWNHPDNSGWQQQFRAWAKSGTFQAVWEVTQTTFGLRFRHFCQINLELS